MAYLKIPDLSKSQEYRQEQCPAPALKEFPISHFYKNNNGFKKQ